MRFIYLNASCMKEWYSNKDGGRAVRSASFPSQLHGAAYQLALLSTGSGYAVADLQAVQTRFESGQSGRVTQLSCPSDDAMTRMRQGGDERSAPDSAHGTRRKPASLGCIVMLAISSAWKSDTSLVLTHTPVLRPVESLRLLAGPTKVCSGGQAPLPEWALNHTALKAARRFGTVSEELCLVPLLLLKCPAAACSQGAPIGQEAVPDALSPKGPTAVERAAPLLWCLCSSTDQIEEEKRRG